MWHFHNSYRVPAYVWVINWRENRWRLQSATVRHPPEIWGVFTRPKSRIWLAQKAIHKHWRYECQASIIKVENIVKLASDGSLKLMMGEKSLINFNHHVWLKFPGFATQLWITCCCSWQHKLLDRMCHTWVKTKSNWLKVVSNMKLKLSSLKTNWISLAYRQKQRHASHWFWWVFGDDKG
jgi:hypothetical protein